MCPYVGIHIFNIFLSQAMFFLIFGYINPKMYKLAWVYFYGPICYQKINKTISDKKINYAIRFYFVIYADMI